MPKTQQERKAETRARLLSAAADLFADQGIDAVSVDAVAEAAGRTSGAVYAHFGSKQGLLLALLDSWKDSVRTVLLAEVAVTDSPAGQLAAVWDNVAGDRRRPTRGGGPSSSTSSGCGRPATPRWPRSCGPATPRPAASAPASWTAGRRPSAPVPSAAPEELAVLVKALLTGLAMQRRLEPEAVSDDLAVRGLGALVGLATDARVRVRHRRPTPPRSDRPIRQITTEGAPS